MKLTAVAEDVAKKIREHSGKLGGQPFRMELAMLSRGDKVAALTFFQVTG